ncbi:hybrid sensor histidine kinase/response regulator [Cryobacterium suzukii]|uniref:histidine kinase n=1 Tax=Cryobacterium suzukii TaxID=1259198 RepID=A0A4R9AHY6_9MICO|nr:response regulator [Cryobacterium suzukii]TFD62598.1 hybrid sensor histidine kinase/response regulator [Cryobacterium suzukii]
MNKEKSTLASDEYSSAQKNVADKNMLEQAVSLQHAIFNSANFACVATDARGVIQIFSVGAQGMLGYTSEDVVNTAVPGDLHDTDEIIARAAQLSAEFGTKIQPGFEALAYKASRGIEDVYELTTIRKDGSRFPTTMSVTALRHDDAEIIGYLLISTDDTARNQVSMAQSVLDQRLRDQQFYTRSLIESNIDALMMTDTRGIISDVNQQMIKLTGRTRDELIGAPCRNFFTDPARADTAIKRALTESKVSDYELTVRSIDGDETDVSYNAATFYDRDRVVQGVFASARDVTERKRFEQALQKTNIDLEHASRMKTEFLATMSHELRTPLNAIIGFSEALKDGLIGELTATQREYIGDIYSSGHHLLSLINDILDLSKVEAGMMDIELETVDVRSLLDQSLLIVREDALVHGLHLVFDGADDLGMPLLDRRKTRQIVYNLLSNAVKFTPDLGAVTLTARRVPRSAVGKIVGTRPVHDFPLPKSDVDHFLEIRVDDTGMGISRENMSKLFLAFSQIDSTLARKFEGTGLGLATVKQMVELQGGTVAVASETGAGSSFAVWLPLGATDGQAPAWPGRATKTSTSDGVSEASKTLDGASSSDVQPKASVRRDPGGAASVVGNGKLPTVGELAEAAPEAAKEEARTGGDESDAVPATKQVKTDSGVESPDTATGIVSDVAESFQQSRASEEQTDKHVVLVIEDDAKGAEVLRLLLEAEEFRVIVARSGEEGLNLAPKQRLSLITLDIRLPGMDGWGFLIRLHEFSDLAAVPIVIIAGDTDVSLALTHGAAAVLEKPISRQALQQSLKALGLSPDARRTRRVLVADDDPETVDVIARFLTRPEYAVERAFTKDEAIEMAQRLHPDLVLLNLMMEGFSGYEVVLALQSDESTEHIPVLIVSGKPLTKRESAAVDSDPTQPVRVLGTEKFNRTSFIAEVKRALKSGELRGDPEGG